MRLSGRVALVTGGGTGIGAATARAFAREGAGVVVLGPEAEPLEAVAVARDRLGGLDVVVGCAGSPERGTVTEMEPAAWDTSLRNNLETAVVTTRTALPALVERGGGSIVLVSSVGGLTAGPGIASYSTAKAALIGLVRSIAVDYGPQGVRANAICPGWVVTRMSEGVVTRFAADRGITEEEAERRIHAVVPLRRPARPEEIASVCLFLASSESSFVTGSVIVADGGQTAVNVGTVPFTFPERST